MSATPVLLDLGNVLVRLRFDRGAEHLRRLAGHDHPALADPASFFTGPRTWALGAGETDPRTFLAETARELGIDASHEQLAAAWIDIFDPWPEMVELASHVIDAGHPTYLLSNTDPLHFSVMRTFLPVLARFTGLHLSYEAGVNKPDPRFFAGAVARFGLDPAACAFVDDRPDNVTAAADLGIPGHVHDGDVEAVRAFLRGRGVPI